LDCRHVCKLCAFHDALHAGKQKEVHHTPLIWRLREPDQGSTVGGLLSVSLPEEHHGRRTFCRRGGIPRTCDSGSAIAIPKEAFTDSFQKLYERCQQCVVKDGDYFEGQ
jgi:hypothetical protein